MAKVKISTEGMMYKGALFGTGLLGVLLWRRDLLPKYMGIISIGAASIGLCSTLWHVLSGRDKKEISNTELDPPDSFYEQIASQVNEQLSRKDSSCGMRELRKRTVDDTKEFDPIAYLRSGTKRTEVPDGQEAISGRGSSLQNCAYGLTPKMPPENDTKPEESASNDNSELSIEEFDEEDSPSSELEPKKERKFVLNIKEMKLRLEKDSIFESEEQKTQKVRLLKEWETVYPELEKEISCFKWIEKGLKLKKILGVEKSKTKKK